MEENKQHVQVPNMELQEDSGLNYIDPFVYACIKRFMNEKTMIAFPSIRTLMETSKLSQHLLQESISRLEAAGYIKVNKQFGKSNTYLFNKDTQFEIFSYDFLDQPNLTTKEKAYLIAAQQHMFKDVNSKTGRIEYDSDTLAMKLGISTKTLMRTEKELKHKNILSLIPSNQMELLKVNGQVIPKTGLNIQYRVYDFNEFSNLIALKFQQQDQRLDAHDLEIQELQQKNRELEEKINKLLSLNNINQTTIVL